MRVQYFLPYQQAWLKDNAPIKIWEKSRRIGATYTQSYEDVRDALSGRIKAVWFSSADESAAKEYILYCRNWCKIFALGNSSAEEAMITSAQNFSILFGNGCRITALSSNPKGFRSKGGKVVLDEFAHHNDAAMLWKAARPAVTWGYPVRIISTHNSKLSLFYAFTEAVKAGKKQWQLHSTDIFTACKQGLTDRIYKRSTTVEEQEHFLHSLKNDCFDESSWMEEYCCIPADENSVLLSYDAIKRCAVTIPDSPALDIPFTVGADIARKGDSTVVWLLGQTATGKVTLHTKRLKNTGFSEQKRALAELCSHPLMQSMCIDSTGIGMQLAEELLAEFGSGKVVPVHFTLHTKEQLAYALYKHIDEQRITLPDTAEIIEDLHSIRRETTAAGNRRLVASHTNGSHGDAFWALALALHAWSGYTGAPFISSGGRRKTFGLTGNY